MNEALQGVLNVIDKVLSAADLKLTGADKEYVQHKLVAELFQRLLVATVEQIPPTELENFHNQSQKLMEVENFQGLSELMHKQIPNFTELVKQESNTFMNEFIQNVKTTRKP